MNINYSLVDKILKTLFPLPEDFGTKDDFEESYDPFGYYDILNRIEKADPEANVSYGATKLVIYSPSLGDVVIKIPFNGQYDEEDYFIPFYHAHAEDTSDYCLSEYEKYRTLFLHGLECFLARTILYAVWGNTRVFLQEFVREINCTDLQKIHHSSAKSKELVKSLIGNKRCPFNRDWLAQCIDNYGYSKVIDFLAYCENVDKDILQDMHGGNYGYRTNGTPAILDYCGYYD